jgi:hypothetical protein
MLAMTASIFCDAQQIFYSQSLENLYRSLSYVCRVDAAVRDTVILCSDIVSGDTVPLIFRLDENRVLEHIGVRFLQSDSVQFNDAVIRFIERELLSMLLTTNITQTLITWRENSLSVLLDNTPVGQRFLQNKRQLLHLLKNSQSITMNYDGKQYDVTLYAVNKQALTFRFKPDSELLTGMDKKERDVQLAVQLKNHSAVKKDSVVVPDYSYLRLLHDSIYVDKGSEFMIPEINSDLFYIRADSVYTLAFDTSNVAESFSNAMLAPPVNDFKINVTHRLYGKVVKKYTVNGSDFYNYFLRDYDRYFGIESLGKEKLTGTLILSNRNAGNIHLAFVSVSPKDLLNGGTIEMQLHSNIPQQNIKTLFGKY